jgi:catechol 2,3-dioxygenase-like lactoylglutathione lyase family enzyme
MRPTGLNHVGLITEHPERTARFYTDVLGLHRLRGSAAIRKQGIIWLKCGSQQIHIIPLTAVRASGKRLRKARHRAQHIAIEVRGMTSVASFESQLRRKGIKVVTTIPKLYAGMMQVFMKDPSGNTVEAIQPVKFAKRNRRRR